MIETNGEVYILETNGLNIEARFDPSGRWVLFATERVGEAGKELYIFDRETTSTDLVQAGDRVAFDFLTDGRLIIDYRETEDSDRQYYVGVTDGSALELLDISDDIPGNRSVSADGQHLVYRDIDSSFGLHLVIADLDGSNAKELAQGYRSRLDGLFSPDSQSILLSVIGIGEENDAANTVMLHNLTTDETRPIAEGSHYLDLGFSDDSQWAFVLSTISASSTGAEEQRTLYVVRTADGGVREIDDAVSAFFSPDSTQLAYTVRGLDGNPEMYVTSLEDESVQSLGPGVVMGWFPVGVAP